MKLLDPIGALCDFSSTALFARASFLAWPTGMCAALVNGIFYFQGGLYADTFLQIIFFISMVYGWLTWLYGGQKHQKRPIKHLSKNDAISLSIVASIGFVFLAYMLRFHSPSQVPYWDSITTVIYLSAQWLTCRKIIESWYVWFVGNCLYFGLYSYKHMPFHALLMVVYLATSMIGLYHWKKLYRREAYQHTDSALAAA